MPEGREPIEPEPLIPGVAGPSGSIIEEGEGEALRELEDDLPGTEGVSE
jgi:hypothetical protein